MYKNIMTKIILTAILLLLLQSCFCFPRDGGFRVSGLIKNQNNNPIPNCNIELLDKEDHVVMWHKNIESEFEVRFTVAPFSYDYWLVLKCPEYKTKKIIVEYGKAVYPSKPLQLGTIILEKQ